MGLFIPVAVTPAIKVNLRVVVPVAVVVAAMATIALVVAIARAIIVTIGMTPRRRWGATRDDVHPPHELGVPLATVFAVMVPIADMVKLVVEVVAAVMVVVTFVVAVAAAILVMGSHSRWSASAARTGRTAGVQRRGRGRD